MLKDWKKAPPIIGNIYWLHDFTAPKVWTGEHFECLVTDQIIPQGRIKVRTEINIQDWPHEIYKPKRFVYFFKNLSLRAKVVNGRFFYWTPKAMRWLPTSKNTIVNA